MCEREQVAQSRTPSRSRCAASCGEDREALLDRVICQRLLADPAGALPTGQKPRRVSLGGGAQRRRTALDPPRASALREPAALVAGEHEAAVDEERFQQPRCVSRAAPRPAAVRDRGDQRGWPLNTGVERLLQAAQVPHADRGR